MAAFKPQHFNNRLVAPEQLDAEAIAFPRSLAEGPTFAHMVTKIMLAQEWSITVDQALEAEARAQAIYCRRRTFTARIMRLS